jgi:GrpB-like predicted nucleotidyltransferase (UPF0157 family)
VDRRERDEYLDRILVGGREKREIVIADYDPTWPTRFEDERERIRGALGAVALRVEHFGSTAVPGLAAKAIVDVLVTVEDLDETLVPALEAAGYELRVREAGHLMFRTPARDVHVHLWADRDPEVQRHLLFRDRLRDSIADRDSYEQLKRRLATRDWDDMNDYADAKADLISAIVARASARP